MAVHLCALGRLRLSQHKFEPTKTRWARAFATYGDFRSLSVCSRQMSQRWSGGNGAIPRKVANVQSAGTSMPGSLIETRPAHFRAETTR